MKSALVMGGTGNIGVAVTRRLLLDGYDVTVLTRTPPAENPYGVHMLIADRGDDVQLESVLRNNHFEYVVDLVCHCEAHAQQDLRLFPCLRRLIAVSSGAVYGPLRAESLPIREETCRAPVWEYGARKKAMEDVFLRAWLDSGFPVTLFRPTVTYGRQRTLVRQIGSDNSWVTRIRRGEPIAVGNGKLLRNFLYVDDAALAFSGAFRHDVCGGQVYNLCGLKPYDWEAYHRAMMRVLGREVEMVEVPLDLLRASSAFPLSDMIVHNFIYNGYYSGEKIARDLPEFRALTPLEDGLRKTVCCMESRGLLVLGETTDWEDELIAARRAAYIYLSRKGEEK